MPLPIKWVEPPIEWQDPPTSETSDADQPIPFFPDDLPDLDMKAGGWEKDDMRTAIITARRQLHVDTNTLADPLSNV